MGKVKNAECVKCGKTFPLDKTWWHRYSFVSGPAIIPLARFYRICDECDKRTRDC